MSRIAASAALLLSLGACSSTTPVGPPSCTELQTACGSTCAVLANDDAHCGACETSCATTESCAASACYPDDCAGADCSASQVCPAGSCVERACVGVVCPSGTACLGGVCEASACSSSACPAGFVCLNDGCVDPSCLGVRCPGGSTCRLGACVDASTCSDGVKNGSEADLDCGGACVALCATGQTCTGGNDCASGRCVSGLCTEGAASCTDGRRNGSEGDVDCGGPCTAKCSAGQTCGAHQDCATLTCLTSGRCADDCGNGVKDALEADVDCGGSCAAKCVLGQRCLVVADCVAGACTGGRCVDGCTDGVRSGDETDVDCGGSCATKCANNRACTVAGDCDSRRCAVNVCLAPSCTDGLRDGDESDVDCGGSCTANCAVGQLCGAGADCIEKVCAANRCAAPTCSDGARNGNESDLDCGRNCPTRCLSGQQCVVPNDCAMGQCVSGTCPTLVPSCMDGFLNQDEVDVDCGGASCTKCGLTKICRAPSDCLSGYCSRGLTCVTGFADTRTFGGGVWGLATGDVNADGLSDMITVEGNTTLNLYLGQVDAGFLAPTPTTINVSGYSNPIAALEDFTGDGRLDAVTIATNTGSNEILFFRGAASGSPTPWLAPTVVSAHPGGSNHRKYTTADFSGDGKLDLATVWSGAGVPPAGFVVLKSTALGFTVGPSLTLTGRTPFAQSCVGITSGDFDGDGRPDIAVACEPSQVWIALNQGNDVFQLTTTVASAPINANNAGMASLDVDGDMRIDLVVGDSSGRVHILLGNGNGTFSGPLTLNAGGWVQEIRVRDMNRDGRPDLLLGNSGGAILLGDGTGGYLTGPSYGAQFYTLGMGTGDFNGDGLIDFCHESYGGGASAAVVVCRYQQ